MNQENEIGQTAKDVKASGGEVVEESIGKAEQVWDDTRERVQTFKETANQYVRENPTKAVFTALGIGILAGLIISRH